METRDTIAAISSGLTESGIGIVRISGPESFAIADRIARNKKGEHISLEGSHRVRHCFLVVKGAPGAGGADSLSGTGKADSSPDAGRALRTASGTGGKTRTASDAGSGPAENVSRETLDEVLLIYMRGPGTYTGEDTVEINCHGGVLMMRRVLEALLDAGARHAEPGEFTKRAFLNGRMDLAEAEAVADLISAKSDSAIRASLSQLRGGVSEAVGKVRRGILEDTAFIEAALDDPEHYDLDGFTGVLSGHLGEYIEGVNRLISSFSRGKYIKEGVNTVIIGKPNAGKSSLLNAMLGEERAIVTDVPGTTRDTISEYLTDGNISLCLTDTAGLRDTIDPVENIGVERTREKIGGADLILCVLDRAAPADERDFFVLRLSREAKGRMLLILNKSDLEPVMEIEMLEKYLPEDERDVICVSAKTGEGVERIFERAGELFLGGEVSADDQAVISSVRHLRLLKDAQSALINVRDAVKADLPEDFFTIDLMNAYRALGEIIGEEVGEDLIDEIFSKFCLGK